MKFKQAELYKTIASLNKKNTQLNDELNLLKSRLA